MPKGSYLINTSRGAIIDEVALIEALKSNHLKGAALDVLNNEPTIPKYIQSYLRSHQNLIITPHIAGSTYEAREKTDNFVIDKFLKFCNISPKN